VDAVTRRLRLRPLLILAGLLGAGASAAAAPLNNPVDHAASRFA